MNARFQYATSYHLREFESDKVDIVLAPYICVFDGSVHLELWKLYISKKRGETIQTYIILSIIIFLWNWTIVVVDSHAHKMDKESFYQSHLRDIS